MAKPPSKRGSSRGKSGARGGKPAPAQGTRKGAGTKLPGWMPEPLPKPAPSGRKTTKSGKPGKAARGSGHAAPAPAGRRAGQERDGLQDPHAAREASRYENPIASREAILQLLVDADGPQSAEALAERLHLTEPDRFDALGKRLGAMVRDGQLLQNRRGGDVPAERLDLIPGPVIANPNGFGFLRPDSGVGDDLFLPPAEMRKVLHGDRVLASVTGMDRRGREGAIVEVLERRLNRLIGRFEMESGISFVVPDDARVQ